MARYDDKDWHTDDSDWESTDKDDDDEDLAISVKISKTKKSKSYNTIDDGDKDVYLSRYLLTWFECSWIKYDFCIFKTLNQFVLVFDTVP